MKENGKPGERMVHVRLEEELHRRLRILVAAEDESIQEFVSKLIEREIGERETGQKNEAPGRG